MRLKRDKNGQIIQTNYSMNGEEGIGRVPELVEEGNLYELTEVEDPKVIAERNRAKALGELDKVNKAISYKNFMKAQAQAAKNKQLLGEQQFHALNKLHEVQNYRNNVLKSQALKQGNMMTENLSGVSGYGLTADGRQPLLSQAAVDFQPIVTTEKAFGGYDKGVGWGHDMQMGATSYCVASSGTCVTPQETVVPPATAIVDASLPGGYSTLHQFIIDTWENDTYTRKIQINTGTQVYTKTFNSGLKRSINTYNENHSGVRAVIEAAQKGWMWSGWHNPDGSWVSVKVPFSYGLPMFIPGVTKDVMRTFLAFGNNYKIFDAEAKGHGEKTTYFNTLKPVIEAYARYYKYVQGAKEQEMIRIEQEALNAGANAGSSVAFQTNQAAQGAAVEAMTGSIEKLLAQLKAGEITRREFMQRGGFAHPFAKYNLLKGK